MEKKKVRRRRVLATSSGNGQFTEDTVDGVVEDNVDGTPQENVH